MAHFVLFLQIFIHLQSLFCLKMLTKLLSFELATICSIFTMQMLHSIQLLRLKNSLHLFHFYNNLYGSVEMQWYNTSQDLKWPDLSGLFCVFKSTCHAFLSQKLKDNFPICHINTLYIFFPFRICTVSQKPLENSSLYW